MDKKTIIGLVLMVAVFVGFSFYQSHEAEKYAEYRREVAAQQHEERMMRAAEEEAARLAEESMSDEERYIRDSVDAARKLNAELYAYGSALYDAKHLEEQSFVVENDLMKVEFSTRGGKIRNVALKNYTKYADGERTELVELMQPATAHFNIAMHTESGTATNSEEFVYGYELTEGEDKSVVTMTLNLAADAWLKYIYTIYNTGNPSRDYLIDFDIEQQGLKNYLAGELLDVEWSNKSNKNERGFQMENLATTIAYYEREDKDWDTIDADGDRESVGELMWVALKQQYFSSAFISADNFAADMSFASSTREGQDFIKAFNVVLHLPIEAAKSTLHNAFYYGHNDFKILNAVEFNGEKSNLEELIPMGGWLVGWINRYFTIPIFHWLKDNGLNFGIIILILTILVKLIILPLTYKSYISTAKMRAIRPEMEALNAKYPNQEDAMKKQQAMMELYSKAGISPMGGCLPMLIQMPILWAMFRFFPASIELRGQGFLWSDDLSSYDSILDLPFTIPFYGDHVSLFALLMTVTLFGYSMLTYQQQAASTPQAGAGMMKFMMVYFMPLMMLFFLNSYSSGLCYYYFLSQLFTMIIMFVIRRTVDDEKVRAKLLAAKNKPKKKSKFQERYEEALRQQQESLNREQRRGRR